MGAPVVHFEIIAKNGKMIQDFYSNLFDWKIDTNNPMNYGLVNTGSKLGAQGGIGQEDPSMPAPPVTFYIEVKDLQASLTKAEGLGGRTIMPPMDIPGMISLAMFADPEGNVIGLVKSMTPAAGTKKPRKAKKSARKKKPAKKTAKKRRSR